MKIWRRGAPALRAHCLGVDGRNLPFAASCNKAINATIWAAVVANAAPAKPIVGTRMPSPTKFAAPDKPAAFSGARTFLRACVGMRVTRSSPIERRGRRHISDRRRNIRDIFSRSKNYEVALAPGVEPGKKGRGPRTSDVDWSTMMSKAGTKAKERMRV